MTDKTTTPPTGNLPPRADEKPVPPAAPAVEQNNLSDDQLDGVSGGIVPRTRFS
ncbi:hypothetical protein P7L74_09695 [Tistrella mobilis]|uniref:hypothetical protein n=1 Tax=Tistrella mobilis TaxID=171437 RepID=UPI0035583E3F